jgi:hypothetical protein
MDDEKVECLIIALAMCALLLIFLTVGYYFPCELDNRNYICYVL